MSQKILNPNRNIYKHVDVSTTRVIYSINISCQTRIKLTRLDPNIPFKRKKNNNLVNLKATTLYKK